MKGLVLGGGGARCFAHLGILDELKENKIKPDILICSSMGSLMGALYSFGVSSDDIIKEFSKLSTKLRWFIPNGLSTFSHNAAITIMKNLISTKNIEDAPIPLVLMGTNLNNGNEVLLEKGDLIKAVCASMSYPTVHKPIKYGDQYIADGGILDNVPADICREKVGKNGKVLSVSLAGPLDTKIPSFDKFHLLFRSIYIPLLHYRSVISKKNSDLILKPLYDIKFNFHNWKNIMDMHHEKKFHMNYAKGRREARDNMSKIKKIFA
tara:strand:- start:3677 stop:4471 length:795 start_codon:yes stop_codon:yes gene_type:complete